VSPIRTPGSQRRGARSTRRRGFGLAAGAGVLALALSGCQSEDLPRLGMPAPKTEEGKRVLFLWQGSWIAAFIIGGLTLALIIGTAIAFRRKHAGLPPQLRYNLPLEVFYTIVPLMIIGVLFFYTARDEDKLTQVTNYDHTVAVVAKQWSWTFNYQDENVYETGTPGELPTLWLPVSQKVRFQFTSPDVAHDFWVPKFLWKVDVIPGRQNERATTPTHIGNYAGKCAELCGVDHSRMLFRVNVVSDADYKAHIADLRAKGQVGQLKTANDITNATKGQGKYTGGDTQGGNNSEGDAR
jgi:cytochrome c oxidase subunit 2